MKFGGTSVEDATAIDRIAGIVKDRAADRPVVVVSAMAKVTDQLLAMANAAGAGDLDKSLELCLKLRERHYTTAGELLGTGLHTGLHSELGDMFDALEQLLRGICAVGELTPRTSDHVASFGERLSSMIITPAFVARGLNATLLDARQVIITDAQHMRAVPQVDEINHRLQVKVRPLLARRPSTGDGRIHWLNSGGQDHDDWPRWLRFFCSAGGRRTECGAHRDLDRR